MKRKLKSRRGETLTEILIAIFVTALAICLLAGMVSASMSINSKVREADAGENGFYPALSAVETHVFDHKTDSSLKIKVTSPTLRDLGDLSDVYIYRENGLTVYGKEG